jgi:hypothetical protein
MWPLRSVKEFLTKVRRLEVTVNGTTHKGPQAIYIVILFLVIIVFLFTVGNYVSVMSPAEKRAFILDAASNMLGGFVTALMLIVILTNSPSFRKHRRQRRKMQI